MPILKKIKENLKTISHIETITRAYQEIANLRMNKIRRRVLDNREFIEELSRVYIVIRKTSGAQLKKTSLIKKGAAFITGKSQRVVVFLSGNERFYGTLILDIWREIANYLAENKAVLAVIGRIGKYLAEGSGFGHKMFYFELHDNIPKKEEIKGIIEFVRDYEEIILFHGRFQTILSQKVVQSSIAGKVFPEKEFDGSQSYLLEPSAETVLQFFESELISAFLNQAVLEHQLSRYAARMIAMHQATENIKEAQKKLKIEQKGLERQLLNKKQAELFAGSRLWT
jgi:F-type H+-transporting ATPase subunit gamma